MRLDIINLLVALVTLAAAAGKGTKWTSLLSAADTSSPIQDTSAPAPPDAGVVYKHFDCGTDKQEATNEFISTVGDLYSGGGSNMRIQPGGNVGGKPNGNRKSTTSGPIKINLYMHVVASPSNANLVTKGQMAQQFQAMNKAYSSTGVQFTLLNTSWTVNQDWASGADAADAEMKQALRQGKYADLNLYFQTDLAGGILGKCNFPSDQGTAPQASDYVGDGCNIAAGTVPGGPIYGYNAGMTAVHEVGHWLGLLHTFEGYSCSGNGDFIDDTPSESQSTDGCPTKPAKNTCASTRKGVDPIHNYMDYSTDACYTQFTKGQAARILNLWGMYRQGK